MDKYLVVLAGAGLGGLARYVGGTWIMEKYGGRFPLGTFIINITGSFLIGVLMTLFLERWQPNHNWRLFLVVGVLGGYTTFSSFEYETYQSVRDGARWMGESCVYGCVCASSERRAVGRRRRDRVHDSRLQELLCETSLRVELPAGTTGSRGAAPGIAVGCGDRIGGDFLSQAPR